MRETFTCWHCNERISYFHGRCPNCRCPEEKPLNHHVEITEVTMKPYDKLPEFKIIIVDY